MEIDALTHIIPRWKENPNVIGYCHDNDSKSKLLLTQMGWDIQEFIDANHALKSFDRKFLKFNSLAKSKLFGLHSRMRAWLNYIIHLDDSMEKKTKLWKNSYCHFVGLLQDCLHDTDWTGFIWPHAHDLDARIQLRDLILKSLKILKKTNSFISTQLCENMHSIKSHYAMKNYCWQTSWKSRVCAAILQINEPALWKFDLYYRLGLPSLSNRAFDLLIKDEAANIQERIERSTPDFQKNRKLKEF
jgi:hypothetical protein